MVSTGSDSTGTRAEVGRLASQKAGRSDSCHPTTHGGLAATPKASGYWGEGVQSVADRRQRPLTCRRKEPASSLGETGQGRRRPKPDTRVDFLSQKNLGRGFDSPRLHHRIERAA